MTDVEYIKGIPYCNGMMVTTRFNRHKISLFSILDNTTTWNKENSFTSLPLGTHVLKEKDCEKEYFAFLIIDRK
jgi:hypothetical protein